MPHRNVHVRDHDRGLPGKPYKKIHVRDYNRKQRIDPRYESQVSAIMAGKPPAPQKTKNEKKTACPDCGGAKKFKLDTGDWVSCSTCNGSGEVPKTGEDENPFTNHLPDPAFMSDDEINEELAQIQSVEWGQEPLVAWTPALMQREALLKTEERNRKAQRWRENSSKSRIIEQQIPTDTKMATGARNFQYGREKPQLTFNVLDGNWKYVRITLDPSDTYTVEHFRRNSQTLEEIPIHKTDGIYYDMLGEVVYNMTHGAGSYERRKPPTQLESPRKPRKKVPTFRGDMGVLYRKKGDTWQLRGFRRKWENIDPANSEKEKQAIEDLERGRDPFTKQKLMPEKEV